MNSREDLFQNAPISKSVFQMAIPTVISSLVLVIYNMADTFFIGQTHDPLQVAAVYFLCADKVCSLFRFCSF